MTIGLAACPFCKLAYPGVSRGVACPGCTHVNASRRTECVSCKHDLTRPCARCTARSPLDLVACWHCHAPFGHPDPTGWTGTAAAGSQPGATTAQDPCHVLSTLDDILKS